MRILEILLEYKTPVDALKTLLALWRRQSSEAEAESGRNLYKNVLAKVSSEFGSATASEMDRYIQSGQADQDDARLKPAKRDANGNVVVPAMQLIWPPLSTKTAYKPQSKPQPKTKSSSNSKYSIIRIMRMYEPDTGVRGTNKVWGFVKIDDMNFKDGGFFVVFWGRHKSQLQTSTGDYTYTHNQLLKLAQSKLKKGYKLVDAGDPEYQYIFDQLNSLKF